LFLDTNHWHSHCSYHWHAVVYSFELGYNCYNDTLLAIYGPAGVDPAVVKKIEDAFEKAQETPAWK
jgi:hypothetical protein